MIRIELGSPPSPDLLATLGDVASWLVPLLAVLVVLWSAIDARRTADRDREQRDQQWAKERRDSRRDRFLSERRELYASFLRDAERAVRQAEQVDPVEWEGDFDSFGARLERHALEIGLIAPGMDTIARDVASEVNKIGQAALTANRLPDIDAEKTLTIHWARADELIRAFTARAQEELNPTID